MAPLAAPGSLPHQLAHGLQVDRLDQLLVETELASPGAVRLLPVAGHGHEQAPLAPRLAKAAGEFVAVHDRQADVHQRHLGIQLLGRLKGFGTKEFKIPFDATGKKWVRFAVWDSAGNGAFVQPIALTGAGSITSAAR